MPRRDSRRLPAARDRRQEPYGYLRYVTFSSRSALEARNAKDAGHERTQYHQDTPGVIVLLPTTADGDTRHGPDTAEYPVMNQVKLETEPACR